MHNLHINGKKTKYKINFFIVKIIYTYVLGLYLLRSRSSINGKELPSARFISSSITEFKRAPDMKKTQAMAIWGLFIGYDMAHTPASNMGKMY